jgi:hypothetical protein|nr:MAG TPA: hypothetical protein [Bacteriophage sp.]
MEYKIDYIGDSCISDTHHIGIIHDGNYYSVIFGKYINGGFFSIPNWNCGGELAGFNDIFWNTESIYKSLKKKKVAKVIAQAIADYIKEGE